MVELFRALSWTHAHCRPSASAKYFLLPTTTQPPPHSHHRTATTPTSHSQSQICLMLPVRVLEYAASVIRISNHKARRIVKLVACEHHSSTHLTNSLQRHRFNTAALTLTVFTNDRCTDASFLPRDILHSSTCKRSCH